jgi:hypothetical protein
LLSIAFRHRVSVDLRIVDQFPAGKNIPIRSALMQGPNFHWPCRNSTP